MKDNNGSKKYLLPKQKIQHNSIVAADYSRRMERPEMATQEFHSHCGAVIPSNQVKRLPEE